MDLVGRNHSEIEEALEDQPIETLLEHAQIKVEYDAHGKPTVAVIPLSEIQVETKITGATGHYAE
jgi:hypothetical protein